MRDTNNKLKHIDGFYNMAEMSEKSGKNRGAIYTKIMKNCPFRFGYISNRIYAIKESFDKWLEEGCPNVTWANYSYEKKKYSNIPYKYKECKHYFHKCDKKYTLKKRHCGMLCPLRCEHFESRYKERHPTYKYEFELPNDKNKIAQFLAYLKFKQETTND